MTEMIVAIFNIEADAARAETDLRNSGIAPAAIRRYHRNENVSPSATTTHTTTTDQPEESGFAGFWHWLTGEETTTQHEHADIYENHLRAGQIIVSVQANNDTEATEISRILDRHAPNDVTTEPESTESTAATTPSSSSSSSATNTGPGSSLRTDQTSASALQADQTALRTDQTSPATTATNTAGTTNTETVIPLAEEQLEVGKRTEQVGTTRVRRYVVEKPVTQTIPLRDETTTIERRTPLSGTTTTSPQAQFEERVVEVTETREVPVVNKTAQTTEEVVIGKTATEHTENVNETVRRTEVDIEEPGNRATNDPAATTNPANPAARRRAGNI